MAQGKRRSDIAKLVTRSREVWRMSVVCQEVKRQAKAGVGWYKCKLCGQSREVIRIDHITPIGKQPDSMIEFGSWLEKLFCGPANLQPLCQDCHKEKSKNDKKALKEINRNAIPE